MALERRKLRQGEEPPTAGAAAEDLEPDQSSVARSIALRLLTAAPRTRQQLAVALAARGVPESVADEVLNRYEDVGLIDDRAYAESFARGRLTDRGQSRRAIAHGLRDKGVDEEVAREVLDQIDPEVEVEAARSVAAKKMRSTRGLDRQVRYRRVAGALGRKGFSGDIVRQVIAEAFADEDDNLEDDELVDEID